MRLTLTCVRHGEALHNITTGEGKDKSDDELYTKDGILDTDLTELGKVQIEKVGARLADLEFDMAVSSDLKRARDTALAITGHHPSLELNQWTCVRERQFGVIERSREHGNRLLMCMLQVENFIQDRTALTWRVPEGGESVMDLRARINEQLLPKLFSEARKRKSSKVLFVSHGLVLMELHRMFGDISTKRENFDNYDKSIYNTAVTRYDIDVEDRTNNIVNIHCSLFACYEHLK